MPKFSYNSIFLKLLINILFYEMNPFEYKKFKEIDHHIRSQLFTLFSMIEGKLHEYQKYAI